MVRLDPSDDLLNDSMDGSRALRPRRSTRLSKNSDLNGRFSETAMTSEAACNFSLANSLLNDNLTCNCCLDILKNPVSLTCGHSYCELCLANWYNASKNRQCPVCRQKWHGVPKPNQALVTIIKKLVENDPTISATYDRPLTALQKKTLNKFRNNCGREQTVNDQETDTESTEWSVEENEIDEETFEINTSSDLNSSNHFVPARTSASRITTPNTTRSTTQIRSSGEKNGDCCSSFLIFMIGLGIFLCFMCLDKSSSSRSYR